MKLYHSATSPYVRKVMIFLELTGLRPQVQLVPGSGTPIAPNADTVTVNPLGKVPCLVTDDGLTLYDSRVITRWLDAMGGAGLYPQPPQLWPVLTLEALADGILDAAVLCVYEARLRPEELRFAPWVEGQQEKIVHAIGALELEAERHLAGPMTAAHVAAGVALGYVDFRLSTLPWRESSPALAEWYEAFARHPFMRTTAPNV